MPMPPGPSILDKTEKYRSLEVDTQIDLDDDSGSEFTRILGKISDAVPLSPMRCPGREASRKRGSLA